MGLFLGMSFSYPMAFNVVLLLNWESEHFLGEVVLNLSFNLIDVVSGCFYTINSLGFHSLIRNSSSSYELLLESGFLLTDASSSGIEIYDLDLSSFLNLISYVSNFTLSIKKSWVKFS